MRPKRLYLLVYLNLVESDLFDIKEWYKLHLKGIEEVIDFSIKRTLKTIESTPFIFQRRFKEIRVARTKKFPLNIYFLVNEQDHTILIISILHEKRDMNFISNRIE
jgi:plasmid stabilization system protein ParE